MVDDGTNMQSALGTTAGVLKIDLSATTANTTAIKVDGSAVTQPISATALPLPTGASTSALQTTGNTSVASIDTKIPTVGQKAMAGSLPIVIASDQTPIVDISTTGALTAVSQVVALSLNGQSAGTASITGTWVGTITWEGTIDSVNYFPINAVSASTSSPQTTTTVNGLYRITPGGLTQMRANMSAFTSGSASIKLNASIGVGGTFVNQILPSKITDGTNTVAIKPASTPAIATDPALVVAISPNNALTISQIDTNITGTISATDALCPAPAGGGVLLSTAPTASSFVFALVPG